MAIPRGAVRANRPRQTEEDTDLPNGQNRYDAAGDDTFTPVEAEVNEGRDEGDFGFSETTPAPSDDPKPSRAERKRAETDASSADEDNERTAQKAIEKVQMSSSRRRVEVDAKHKTLRPFGSSRRSQRATAKEIDARKDKKSASQWPKRIILGCAIGVVGLAAFNVLTPDHELSANEVAAISQQSMGMLGFPQNAGGGIARDFMQAYLTVQSDDTTNQVLNYYYTGNFGSDSSAQASATGESSVQRTASSSFSQNILYGPTIYGVTQMTPEVGQYLVGALVQPRTTDDGKSTPGEPQMLFFNVNVVYNPDTQTFSIAPSSPTPVSGAAVTSQRDLPKAKELGDGKKDNSLKEQVRSVVNGYMTGYAQTGATDSSKLDQYVTSDAPTDTKRGLDNKLQLADGENSITYDTYASKKDGDTVTEIKARVRAQWVSTPQSTDASDDEKKSVDVSDAKTKVTYGSSYVMTLTRQSDGRYLVSAFRPETYLPDPDAK